MTDALLERLRQSPVVGRYFDTDGQLVEVSGGAGEGEGSGGDGTGEGGEGAGSGQGSGSGEPGAGDQGGEGEGGGESDGDTATVKMTQAEFDAAIEKRLGQARKNWDSEAKTKAEREKMDETERLKAEKADADKAAEDKITAANQRVIKSEAKVAAVAAGVKADRAATFLRLVDMDDIEVGDDGNVDTGALTKAITAALAENPEFKGGSGRTDGRSGGDFNGGAIKSWSRDEIAGLSDEDFDKHQQEIQAAVAAGKVS